MNKLQPQNLPINSHSLQNREMENSQALHDQGKSILNILLENMQMAQSSWAHQSALCNGRSEFENAASVLECDLSYIKITFARDAILSLFRISDSSEGNKATLCRLSKIFQDAAFVSPKQELIKSFAEIVPTKWGSNIRPTKIDLYEWRRNMRDLRSTILAHSTLDDRTNLPLLSSSTRYIELGLKLHQDLILIAANILLGEGAVTGRAIAFSIGNTSLFWDLAQEGFIRKAAERHDKLQSALKLVT